MSSVAHASFSLFLDAVNESSDSSLVFRPVLLVADGLQSRIGVTSQRFIQRRAVDAQGQSIAAGFDRIEAGTICEVDVRERSDDLAEITLHLELTSFTGGSSEPTVEGLNVDVPVICRSGVPYLVGAFDDSNGSRDHTTWLSFGESRLREDSTLSVWLRATRIAGLVDVASVERRRPAPKTDAIVIEQPRLDFTAGDAVIKDSDGVVKGLRVE